MRCQPSGGVAKTSAMGSYPRALSSISSSLGRALRHVGRDHGAAGLGAASGQRTLTVEGPREHRAGERRLERAGQPACDRSASVRPPPSRRPRARAGLPACRGCGGRHGHGTRDRSGPSAGTPASAPPAPASRPSSPCSRRARGAPRGRTVPRAQRGEDVGVAAGRVGGCRQQQRALGPESVHQRARGQPGLGATSASVSRCGPTWRWRERRPSGSRRRSIRRGRGLIAVDSNARFTIVLIMNVR